MLHFINFRKKYGSFPALSIDDFSIDPGIYWIKGANGSGKSSLLKSIAGILSFDGDITLNKNTSIKNNALPYRRLVNFAEAEPQFPQFLTGMEMVSLFMEAKDASTGQEQHYITSMGMQNYINSPVSTYSSGMLKKLSLVLAFLGRPQLILLDEPLITLDTEAVAILYGWIKEQSDNNGVNFILTSHTEVDTAALPNTKTLLVSSQTLQFDK